MKQSLLALLLCAPAAIAGDTYTQPPEPQPAVSAAPVPAKAFRTLPGFQVEKLFAVPRDKLGSWVCITFDDKGRLIASDQGDKGLCRVTPARDGAPTKVEKLDVKITAAQGLLYAFGSLYVCCNGGPGSGLYRVRDTNGDDQFDEVVKLKALQGGGEHGPHALRLSPDGKSIYVAAGNHTLPPANFDHSRLPKNWGEDHLLPRQWDARGHARGILAPGGWIAKTDPDGKTWELVTSGYRNEYDFAFNADGEIFAYDADMEWDFGMPWYRPTRVNHATSGSELGWRSGTGKWPDYYPDSLPAAVDVGPGSPVGVEFGYGTKFPAKYQKALYILDWTFGTIYAIHTEPKLSTYTATKEEFLSRTPLPLTDAVVGPDGALYFTIGGRNTQSELFRVTYAGPESTDRVEYASDTDRGHRAVRRKLEGWHRKHANPTEVTDFAVPLLSHEDRFTRYAARIALEHQPIAAWQERVFEESSPDAIVAGAIAVARQGPKELLPRVLRQLGKLDFAGLPERQQLDVLRAYGLAFVRMGPPDTATAAKLVATFDAFFPGPSDFVNRELCQLLVYLKSPTVVAKTTALLTQPSKPLTQAGMADLLARNKGYGGTIDKMLANAPDVQKLALIFALRNAGGTWTPDQRKAYFGAIADARTKSGGASYQGFLTNIERDAFDNASPADRLAIEAAGLRKPYRPKEIPKAIGPGRAWTTADLVALEPKLIGRNLKAGERAFAAARCVVCHRVAGDGGATGPDLSQAAGRFGLKDLAEAIAEPSKVVSDQYRASVVTLADGKSVTGLVVSDANGKLVVVTDPEDSTKVAEIAKADVEAVQASPTSLMPADLLNPLNEGEVLDLLAYLLSRGDPGHPVFKK